VTRDRKPLIRLGKIRMSKEGGKRGSISVIGTLEEWHLHRNFARTAGSQPGGGNEWVQSRWEKYSSLTLSSRRTGPASLKGSSIYAVKNGPGKGERRECASWPPAASSFDSGCMRGSPPVSIEARIK